MARGGFRGGCDLRDLPVLDGSDFASVVVLSDHRQTLELSGCFETHVGSLLTFGLVVNWSSWMTPGVITHDG